MPGCVDAFVRTPSCGLRGWVICRCVYSKYAQGLLARGLSFGAYCNGHPWLLASVAVHPDLGGGLELTLGNGGSPGLLAIAFSISIGKRVTYRDWIKAEWSGVPGLWSGVTGLKSGVEWSA